MHVAIINYGSGNLHSAAKAFERAARESGSPLAVEVTAEPEAVLAADRVVLPGVGAFADCKRPRAQCRHDARRWRRPCATKSSRFSASASGFS